MEKRELSGAGIEEAERRPEPQWGLLVERSGVCLKAKRIGPANGHGE